MTKSGKAETVDEIIARLIRTKMAIIRAMPDHDDDCDAGCNQAYDDEAARFDETERQNDLYYTHKGDK
jgi:hypothetical protein